jgi:hypothetical protein
VPWSPRAQARAYGDALDLPAGASKWVQLPYTWTMFAAAQVLSGESRIRSVGDFVGDGDPGRVMLIAAGHGLGGEDELNPIWARRADGRVQLWELPEGKHTGAIEEHPSEYERRVVGFFDRLLLRR